MWVELYGKFEQYNDAAMEFFYNHEFIHAFWIVGISILTVYLLCRSEASER